MSAQQLTPLRVNVFPGGFNWPLFVAIARDFFTHAGLAVEVQATTGSVAQMTDFAAGKFEIAMTGFDNIVAYVEGQGEAPVGAQPQFFAFLGSDNSFLSLAARPDVARIEDLRGRTVSVDAATTGYAFVLFDMLEMAGLTKNDYAVVKVGGMAQRFDDLCRGGNAATLLSTPYELLGQQAGLRILQRVDGPYQGNVGAARRDWASAHPDLVAAYITGYLDAVSWLYDPANARQASEILARNVAQMTPELADETYRIMLGATGGFFKDGRVDEEGARKILQLRSRHAADRRVLTDPEKYIDHRYWELARR